MLGAKLVLLGDQDIDPCILAELAPLLTEHTVPDRAQPHLRAHMTDLLECDHQQGAYADLIKLDKRVMPEYIFMQVAGDHLAGVKAGHPIEKLHQLLHIEYHRVRMHRQFTSDAGSTRRSNLNADGGLYAVSSGIARNDSFEVGDLAAFGHKGQQERQLADAALLYCSKDRTDECPEQQFVADHHAAPAAAQIGVQVARGAHLAGDTVDRAGHVSAQPFCFSLRVRQECVDRAVRQTDAELHRCTAFDFFQPQDGLPVLQKPQPLVVLRLRRVEQQALHQQALVLCPHQAVLTCKHDAVRHIDGLQFFHSVNFRIVPHADAPFSLWYAKCLLTGRGLPTRSALCRQAPAYIPCHGIERNGKTVQGAVIKAPCGRSPPRFRG